MAKGRLPTVSDFKVELFTQEEYSAADMLAKLWDGLGRPTDPFSESGIKLMNGILSTWEVLRPEEAYDWKRMRDEYKNNEKDIHQQVKEHSGRILAAMPPLFLTFFHTFFPDYKMDREFFIKLARQFPMMRMANRI